MQEWRNEGRREWRKEWRNYIIKWVSEWVNEWVNKEWMSEWVSEWMSQRMNEAMNAWSIVKWGSCCSLVRILPCELDRANPKLLRTPEIFNSFLCEPDLSLQSRAHFAVQTQPRKSKAVRCTMWNRALAEVSCTFCRPHLRKMFRIG